jgi:hypothetical protein
MTKAEKRLVERLDGAGRRQFIAELRARQKALGDRFRGWEIAYRAKCARKERPCPLDDVEAVAAE